jgi:hypothetical protein
MLASKKPPPPTLAQRIRHAAEVVKAADAEVKETIEAWVDQEKLSQAGAGLPRESIKQMLVSRWREPWYAVLHLASELPNE